MQGMAGVPLPYDMDSLAGQWMEPSRTWRLTFQVLRSGTPPAVRCSLAVAARVTEPGPVAPCLEMKVSPKTAHRRLRWFSMLESAIGISA